MIPVLNRSFAYSKRKVCFAPSFGQNKNPLGPPTVDIIGQTRTIAFTQKFRGPPLSLLRLRGINEYNVE